METPAINPSNPTPASASASSSSGSAAGALASDFETFLTLLTAQLENQDPLQPIDSTEFVAQLAQFSAVEQQVATNAALADILTALEGSTASDVGDWIGREALTQAALPFEDDPIELVTVPDPDARKAELVVSRLDGASVARIEVSPSARNLVWDGTTTDGGTADEGLYRFRVERTGADGAALPDDFPRGFGEVTEVRLVDGDARVVIAGQDEVAAREVVALRSPQD